MQYRLDELDYELNGISSFRGDDFSFEFLRSTTPLPILSSNLKRRASPRCGDSRSFGKAFSAVLKSSSRAVWPAGQRLRATMMQADMMHAHVEMEDKSRAACSKIAPPRLLTMPAPMSIDFQASGGTRSEVAVPGSIGQHQVTLRRTRTPSLRKRSSSPNQAPLRLSSPIWSTIGRIFE